MPLTPWRARLRADLRAGASTNAWLRHASRSTLALALAFCLGGHAFAADGPAAATRYTILLKEPALAAYQGGASFAKPPRITSGAHRGRLDVHSTAAIAYVDHLAEVQNVFVATSPTLTTVTVAVTYPDTRVSGAAPTSVTGAGWSFSSAAHVGSTWVYTFVYGGSVPPGASTSTVDYHVPLTSAAAGTIVITGSAFASGGSTVGTASYKIK